ncbi:MAG: acetyl-CoA carboxylase carboxyltransferase subunit alpha [Proteobacteria bacterium]|nr:acetyl-CoA carboxylase carboxyltransferase subunit alpha [Pseudomonadota bacterium]
MNPNFLEFEQPIAELEAKIDELRHVGSDNAVDLEKEIQRLKTQIRQKMAGIFKNLTPWQMTQMSRHPQRPYTLDYIGLMIEDFQELHGDRAFADDHAMIGGLGNFRGQPVLILGQQKGRSTREKVRRNFGMARPEGYRKAERLMELAARFSIPVLTFIDTPGAYPGIGAEERGQSEAIARNLEVMATLPVPIICTIIGEGGSGGALAIGVGDRVNMLEYSTYSVISPEGCASILWKDAKYAETAAEALGITSTRVKALGLVDQIIPEPEGGAHRDPEQAAANIADIIEAQLKELNAMERSRLLDSRYQRLLSYGTYSG